MIRNGRILLFEYAILLLIALFTVVCFQRTKLGPRRAKERGEKKGTREKRKMSHLFRSHGKYWNFPESFTPDRRLQKLRENLPKSR